MKQEMNHAQRMKQEVKQIGRMKQEMKQVGSMYETGDELCRVQGTGNEVFRKDEAGNGANREVEPRPEVGRMKHAVKRMKQELEQTLEEKAGGIEAFWEDGKGPEKHAGRMKQGSSLQRRRGFGRWEKEAAIIRQ